MKGKYVGVWRTGTLFVLQLSASSEWITENSLSLPVICIAAKPRNLVSVSFHTCIISEMNKNIWIKFGIRVPR
jgi:hypothetical protein